MIKEIRALPLPLEAKMFETDRDRRFSHASFHLIFLFSH